MLLNIEYNEVEMDPDVFWDAGTKKKGETAWYYQKRKRNPFIYISTGSRRDDPNIPIPSLFNPINLIPTLQIVFTSIPYDRLSLPNLSPTLHNTPATEFLFEAVIQPSCGSSLHHDSHHNHDLVDPKLTHHLLTPFPQQLNDL